ncbi:Fumarate hydratase 1, mitochondrial [Musa troglodytarum]|uniref:Fumarate hydratase 1, mitochondrial n=1 Tax=Musa troglodytarum TaxID=320322 RepID=A0A9E7KYZ7_9LILI|nr:Fumarate hydratase 1, mitochondrial [Musa troglodytarum]
MEPRLRRRLLMAGNGVSNPRRAMHDTRRPSVIGDMPSRAHTVTGCAGICELLKAPLSLSLSLSGVFRSDQQEKEAA